MSSMNLPSIPAINVSMPLNLFPLRKSESCIFLSPDIEGRLTVNRQRSNDKGIKPSPPP